MLWVKFDILYEAFMTDGMNRSLNANTTHAMYKPYFKVHKTALSLRSRIPTDNNLEEVCLTTGSLGFPTKSETAGSNRYETS